jgi:hypothetical protein
MISGQGNEVLLLGPLEDYKQLELGSQRPGSDEPIVPQPHVSQQDTMTVPDGGVQAWTTIAGAYAIQGSLVVPMLISTPVGLYCLLLSGKFSTLGPRLYLP